MSTQNAIKADIEQFLKLFSEANTLRFETFGDIWKSLNFSYLYAGRRNAYECLEFAEDCMNIVIDFCFPPCQQQVRVCALYLIYGLFFNYPYQPRIKIRLTLPEWNDLLAFINEMNLQSHLDVEYVFNKLRFNQAFQFVASRKPTSLLNKNSVDHLTEMETNRLQILASQISAPSQIFCSDNIDELANIQEQYITMKRDCMSNDIDQDASINMIDENLVQNITKLVASHSDWRKAKASIKGPARKRRDSGQATSDSEVESEHESGQGSNPEKKSSSIAPSSINKDDNHGDIRSEIKKRAFLNTGSRRKM